MDLINLIERNSSFIQRKVHRVYVENSMETYESELNDLLSANTHNFFLNDEDVDDNNVLREQGEFLQTKNEDEVFFNTFTLLSEARINSFKK